MTRNRALFLSAIFLVFSVISVDAPAQQNTVRVLVPVWLNTPAPGAFGSLWTTEIAVVNSGTTPVFVANYMRPECGGECGPPQPIPPGVTFRPVLSMFTSEVQGIFMLIDAERQADVQFAFRVRDLSRSAETWGTEVPVLREDAFSSAPVEILDVPVRSGFRNMLRIYDLDPLIGPARARVQIFGFNGARRSPFEPGAVPDVLVHEQEISFSYATTGLARFGHPGYAELADVTGPAAFLGYEHVRLRIEGLTPEHRIWGFVSSTHNTTQHVTTISPQ